METSRVGTEISPIAEFTRLAKIYESIRSFIPSLSDQPAIGRAAINVLWREKTAEQNVDLNVNALPNILERIYLIQKKYPRYLRNMGGEFALIENTFSRQLLTDLLAIKRTDKNGDFDKTIKENDVYQRLAENLFLVTDKRSNPWVSNKAKLLKPGDIIKAVFEKRIVI